MGHGDPEGGCTARASSAQPCGSTTCHARRVQETYLLHVAASQSGRPAADERRRDAIANSRKTAADRNTEVARTCEHATCVKVHVPACLCVFNAQSEWMSTEVRTLRFASVGYSQAREVREEIENSRSTRRASSQVRQVTRNGDAGPWTDRPRDTDRSVGSRVHYLTNLRFVRVYFKVCKYCRSQVSLRSHLLYTSWQDR